MGKHITYPKIIFMDLEGTLLRKAIHLDNGKVPPSAWTLLAERLGPDALREEEETKDRWLRGDYKSYIEWMQDTIRIHERYGLTADTFAQVMVTVEEMPGTSEAVSLFHQRGAVTAIISGGFKALADKIDNRSFDFKSNQVLGIVSTRLQEIGFRIEKSSMKERLRSYVKTHHIAAHNTRLANMRHFAKPEEVVWKA